MILDPIIRVINRLSLSKKIILLPIVLLALMSFCGIVTFTYLYQINQAATSISTQTYSSKITQQLKGGSKIDAQANLTAYGEAVGKLVIHMVIALIFFAIAALFLCVALVYIINRSITIPIRSAMHVADNVSHGRFDDKIIIKNPNDDLGKLLTSLKIMQENLKKQVETDAEIVQEVDSVVFAAIQGELDKRIDLNGKEGAFRTLGEGINTVLDTLSCVISSTIDCLTAMAQGDLNKTIQGEYAGEYKKIKEGANMTVRNVSQAVKSIMDAAHLVGTSTSEIDQGNMELSQRTEEQAASLAKTVAQMESLASTVSENAEQAKQANELASQARDNAEKGGKVVTEVANAMKNIHASSKEIADIIGVIDEIAFQTNLLALNAAVEAARAGEQGRGFAVVATEVRNLAQRSAEAAKEIKELINNSVDKINAGAGLVTDSQSSLEEIMDVVGRASEMINKIADASQAQSGGIVEVNRAMAELDKITQQNAALVEEAAAAGSGINDQAQAMKREVAFFRFEDNAAAVVAAKSEIDNIVEFATPAHKESDKAIQSPLAANQPAADASASADWSEF